MTTQTVNIPPSNYNNAQPAVGAPQPPIQITYLNRPTQVPIAIKYRKDDKTAVKWISGIQMFLAVLCVALQAVTVGLADYWLSERRKLEAKFDNVYMYFEAVDSGGTGIWVGILIIITAAIGIASWKQNRMGLIVTYLVLSVCLMPLSIALIGTTAGAVGTLSGCRNYGTEITVYDYSYYDYYYYKSTYYYSQYFWTWNPLESTATRTTTTRAPPASPYLLGENLGTGGRKSFSFHCTHTLFHVWLILDALLVVVSVLLFILTLMSLIYSSKAACSRCCGCQCCLPEQEPSVVYQPQNFNLQYQHPIAYGVPGTTPQPPVPYASQPPDAGVVYPPYPQLPDTTATAIGIHPPHPQRQQQPPVIPEASVASAPKANNLSEDEEMPPPTYTAYSNG